MIMADVVAIAVNISELHWVIVILYMEDAMYLDSGGESPCRFFNKLMDSIMDLEINCIVVLSCLKQKNRFSCGIFSLIRTIHC